MSHVARAAIAAVIRVLIVVCAVMTATVASAVTFVGHVEGSDAYIAVSKDGRKVGGYLCDNGTISRWIEYSWIENGSAPLTAGTTGELLGSVHFINNKAVGTIEIDGQTLHFSAKRVHGAGAGLFLPSASRTIVFWSLAGFSIPTGRKEARFQGSTCERSARCP
jgi:hypothetical protein